LISEDFFSGFIEEIVKEVFMFKEVKSKRNPSRKYWHSQPKAIPKRTKTCLCFVLEKVKANGKIYKCTNTLCNKLFVVKPKK